MEVSDYQIGEADDRILPEEIEVDENLQLSNEVFAIEDIIKQDLDNAVSNIHNVAMNDVENQFLSRDIRFSERFTPLGTSCDSSITGREDPVAKKLDIEQQKLLELKRKVSLPNNYVFAQLSSRIYKEKEDGSDGKGKTLHGKSVDPANPSLRNWKLLTIAHNYKNLVQNCLNGYFGAAYWNPKMQQVIIVHSGTRSVGGVVTDLRGVFLNKYVSHINSAITFTDIIINILRKISDEREREYRPYIQLFFTGHSLGAWLAQITTFTAKYIKRIYVDQKNTHVFVARKDFEEAGYHASAIVFDPPGCKSMLHRIQDKLMNRSSPSLINSLNITTYVAAPNLINACNLHVGDVYKVFINFSDYQDNWWDNHGNYTRFTHQINKIKKVFNPDTGEVLRDENHNLRMKRVIDWPLLVSGNEDRAYVDKIVGFISQAAIFVVAAPFVAVQRALYSAYSNTKWYAESYNELKHFFELANKSNNFHLDEENIYFKDSNNTYRSVRYKTEDVPEVYKKQSNINVFTQSERQFLEIYQLLLANKDFPGVLSPTELFNIALNDPGLVTNSEKMLEGFVIESEIISSDNLPEFIPYIKRMLHIFPFLKTKAEAAYCGLSIDIRKGFFETASHSYLESIDMPLKLKNDTLDLNAFLSSGANILHTNHSDTSVGTAIIYRSFESFINEKTEPHAFLNIDRIFCLGLMLLVSFLNAISHKYLLVIECSNVSEDKMESLVENLFCVIRRKAQMKVIFVTKSNSREQEFIERSINNSDLKNSCTVKKLEVKFTDLNDSSRNELLSKEIIFQGKPVPLGEILGPNNSDLDAVIDPETIIGLLKNESIDVGKALPTLDQNKNYYINRKLIRKVRIRRDAFEDEVIKDLFAISNTTKDELSKLVNVKEMCNFSEVTEYETRFIRVVILDGKNDSADFEALCSSFSQYNLHWLEKEEDNVYWKSSYGTLSYIRNYVDSDFENIFNIDSINILNENFIVIAAEPGMGKSTLLTYLGSKRTESEWVIRINLIERKKKLEENIDFVNVDNIIDFLCNSNENTLSSKLTKKLVKSRFNGSGDLVLLLDGFDEITLHGQESVKKLLKALQATKIKKVLISTRLHLKKDLEDILSTFAYAFQPFSEDDQKEFLRKFWQSTLDSDIEKSHITENSLKNYIDKLLKFISHSIRDKERKFMGIPLQMKMIAEAFQDGLEHSLYFSLFHNEKLIFPKEFDVFELYNRFLQTKYQIYFGKIGVCIDLNDDIQKTWFTPRIRLIHGSIAFNILFPEASADFLQDKLPSEAEKHAMKLVGIVQFINDEMVFIHRTFAEYFAADFLAENLKCEENSQAYKITIHFLEKQLFEKKNKVVKAFLDYHLAKDKIHIAAFKGKLEDVRNTTPEIAINATDILGRSALHYAAQGEYKDVVEDLLTKGANPDAVDKLGKTALHYAARYNESEFVISCFFEKPNGFISVEDKNGYTAAEYASECCKWYMLLRFGLKGMSHKDLKIVKKRALHCHYESRRVYGFYDDLPKHLDQWCNPNEEVA